MGCGSYSHTEANRRMPGTCLAEENPKARQGAQRCKERRQAPEGPAS